MNSRQFLGHLDSHAASARAAAEAAQYEAFITACMRPLLHGFIGLMDEGRLALPCVDPDFPEFSGASARDVYSATARFTRDWRSVHRAARERRER